MDANLSKLNELRANFQSLEKLYKEKSDMAAPTQDNSEMYDLIYRMCASIHNRIDCMQSAFYDYADAHSQGHLPSIKGPAQMNNVLKKLGMDGDYVANPKTVYASIGGKEFSFLLK